MRLKIYYIIISLLIPVLLYSQDLLVSRQILEHAANKLDSCGFLKKMNYKYSLYKDSCANLAAKNLDLITKQNTLILNQNKQIIILKL